MNAGLWAGEPLGCSAALAEFSLVPVFRLRPSAFGSRLAEYHLAGALVASTISCPWPWFRLYCRCDAAMSL